MPSMLFCEWYIWQWKMQYCQSHGLAPNIFGWNKAEIAYNKFKKQKGVVQCN